MQYMFVGVHQDEAVEQSKGFKSVSGIGTVTVMRQECPAAGPGPPLWTIEASTYSTHGNPAHTLWQNTTHWTTVQFLPQYC